jgi:tRNA(Ile)-lysidine synthase
MELKDILSFWEEYHMLPENGKILCAVSGGADSVCMLHLLKSMAEKLHISVAAAHFNHMLRGDESDRDEEFVRSLCEDLNVPFYSGRGDVAKFARENSMGTEEAARKLRYDFLFKTAEEIGAQKIATAHTADDNAETVIMRIARGTGLKGLCGIPPVRDNIIRPILTVTRQEVEDHLEKYGLPHVEDSTNLSDDYTRNKIRHLVMPVLREINPQVSEAVASMTELLRQDESFLEREAEAALKRFPGERLPVKELLELPEPVLRRVIMARAGENLNKVHVESILSLLRTGGPSAELSIPGKTLRREYGDIIFGAQEAQPGFEPVIIADRVYRRKGRKNL